MKHGLVEESKEKCASAGWATHDRNGCMVYDVRQGCKARQEAGIIADKDKEAVLPLRTRGESRAIYEFLHL